MAKIATYRTYIQRLIEESSAQIPKTQSVEAQTIFDTERDHYQLFLVGWDEYRWFHGCVLHFDIKNEKIWIQHNGTERRIADELVQLGVPKEDIVLGFQAPYKRKYTGYAEM